MPANFAPLLEALRDMPDTGPSGFEGLVRDALEILVGHRLYLHKAGPQKGKDMSGSRIAIECKRFKAKTPLALDELKQKLLEACESGELDIWAVALTKEMVQPDWSELRAAAAKLGIEAVALDWRDASGTLPTLAALIANARAIAEQRLPTLDHSIYDDVAAHPQYANVLGELRAQLTTATAGFDLARQASTAWLSASLKSKELARQRLRGHVEVEADGTHYVERKEAEQKLNDWWANTESTRASVLGAEGRGKSWLVLKWAYALAIGEDAPMVVVTSAKDVIGGSVPAIVARAASPALPEVDLGQLELRISRWLRHGDRKILLVIDGLNEHWSKDWPEILRAFDADPWRGKVRVLVTSRTLFWRDDVDNDAAETHLSEIEVREYSDAELDDLLTAHDIKRDDLSEALLSLIRVPRVAALALRQRDRLKERADLTVGDLILEDWRSRAVNGNRRLSVDNEKLIAFVRELAQKASGDPGFQISTREIHATLSSDSGRDLDHYRDAISDLVEGSWLQSTGTKDRYKTNEALLPYAIGLDLAFVLESEETKRAAEETIARYVDALRGADVSVNIIRAACSLILARGKAHAPIKTAIIEAWLGAQNFSLEDFRQFWPLVSRDPALFIQIAETSFSTPLRRSDVTEILVKALANANKWPDVHDILVETLPRWAGSYGRDPLHWRLGSEIEIDDTRIAATSKALAEWKAIEHSINLDLARRLRPDASDHLGDAALSILSFVSRTPFVETLVTYALAKAIMGDRNDEPELHWVLRRNEEDPAEAKAALIAKIESLMKVGSDIAVKVATVLAEGLATTAALTLLPAPKRESGPFLGRWPVVNQHNEIEWRGDTPASADMFWELAALTQLASNPGANLGEGERANLAAIQSGLADGSLTIVDLLRYERDVSAALARWAPGAVGKAIAKDWAQVADAEINAGRRSSPLASEDLYLALDPNDAERLFEFALELTPPSSGDDANRDTRRRAQNLALLATAFAPAARQTDLVRRIGHPFNFEIKFAELLAALTSEEATNLVNTVDDMHAADWLAYVEAVGGKETIVDSDKLLTFAEHPDQSIRVKALAVLSNHGSERIQKAFAAGAWSYREKMGRVEIAAGSYVVSRHMMDAPIEEVAHRISPELVPQAIELRRIAPNDVAYFHGALDKRLDEEIARKRTTRTMLGFTVRPLKVMKAVVAIDNGAILRKLDTALTKNQALGFMREFPLTELVAAAIDHDPDFAAGLWNRAMQANRSISFNDGDLTALAFAKTDSKAFEKLRTDTLTGAKNDSELAHYTFFALRNGHEEWLLSFLREQMNHPSAGRIALSLTVSGYLDVCRRHLGKSRFAPVRNVTRSGAG
jgi:hypothetical protein